VRISPEEVFGLKARRVPLGKGILNLALALLGSLRSPGLWMSGVLLALAAGAMIRYTSGLSRVTLVVDDASRQVRTRCLTVGELLDGVGVAIGEGDWVMPDLETPVRSWMTISVQHAYPVTVIADGIVQELFTHSRSVDEILAEAGVRLEAGDEAVVNGGAAEGKAGNAIGNWLPAWSQGRSAVRSALSSRGVVVEAQDAGNRDAAPISLIQVQRAAVITLDDDGVEQTLRTTAPTVGRVLAEAQILVYMGDRVYPPLNTAVTTGMHVRIERGVPVSVLVDGGVLHTRTQRETVGDVLVEVGVSLMGRDFVQPALDVEVEPGLLIRVVRLDEKTMIEQEEIPFETEWIPDSTLEIDHRRVDDVGANGIHRRRYKVIYHDGQEVERYLEEQWVAQEPRARQIAYGTNIVVRTLETPDGPIEYWRRIRVFLTSYTAATCGKTPDHPMYGITRLGWEMRHGIIAVDPQVIALRSQLYVPGYGLGVAGDTGGMIKGRHIDLGHEEDNFVMYYEWGYVYVLTPVPPASRVRWILPDFPKER
jgi:uncharacterized protein YabE (DUF348 family)/3D (Asp-Asp-Asp) domain-containing protein